MTGSRTKWRPRAVAVAPLLWATVWAAGPSPVFHESFDTGTPPENATHVQGQDGVVGPYCRYRGVANPPRIALPEPLTGDYSLTVWLRASEWLEESSSGFGRRVPPTLFTLYSSEKVAPVVFRVCLRRLQVAVNREGTWGHASGWRELPERRWVHAALVRQGETVRFHLNGVEEAAAPVHRCGQPLRFVRVGSSGTRTFHGDLDEAKVWNRALTPDEIAAMVPESVRSEVAAFPASSSALKRPAYPGRELRVKDGADSPLVAALSAHCLAVPWYGRGRSDALAQGVAFNAHPAVYRQVSGLRFAAGVPVADLKPGTTVPGPPFFRVDRDDGLFDLISTGRGTAFADHLLYHRNTGREGAPAFTDTKPVSCAGTVFRRAYGAFPLAVQDIDGDGVVDLLLARGHKGAPYAPDAPKGFWGGEELPSSGKGRGYGVNGRWLGHEGRHVVEWVRGSRGEGGELAFGKRTPVYLGREDFPLQWKGHGAPRAAWLRLREETWLVLAGSVDRILAVPVRLEGDTIRCGEPRRVLASGDRLTQVYYPHAIDVRDIDGDGHPELLLSGNPGSFVVLRGRRMGEFREEAAQQVGGPLAMQTLIVPCRVDWNGDNTPDIVAGDSSGWLMLWPGTEDAMAYESPVSMTVDGDPVHVQAGYDGSIQGPNEARWGYLNPTVGDWDGDGRLDIVSCDINADVLWYRAGDSLSVLRPPVRFTMDGEKLPAAWRQRPAILPAEHGIAGNRPCLLHMNWDGVLSIGVPDGVGSTRIAEQRALRYRDGTPVKLDGPAGLWGRAKFAVTDWDGDGVWDVLFGTNRSDHRFFSKECEHREAMPFLLRNAGTAGAPVLEPPVPIKLGDVYLAFGVHIAAVWPTDMDGDGRDDLIIGAEDGRVYRFLRDELRP